MIIAEINKILEKFLQDNLPIILMGNTQDARRLITFRFLGYIKEIKEKNYIVFHKFKPLLPYFVFKNEPRLKAIFSISPQNGIETVLQIKEIDTDEIYTDFPENFYVSRPIRIEPNPKKPVLLYVLSKDDPTNLCDVINISEKGVCFISQRDYIVNGEYGFMIILPDQLGVITCYGEIKYKKIEKFGYFRYGAELFNHAKDRAVLSKYIMIREKEIIELLRGG